MSFLCQTGRTAWYWGRKGFNRVGPTQGLVTWTVFASHFPYQALCAKRLWGLLRCLNPLPGEPPSYSHSFIVLSSNYLREVLLVSYLFQEFSGFSLVN